MTTTSTSSGTTIDLAEVVRVSLDEIYLFDPATMRFRYVNDSALANLGYTFDEIARMTPLDLKPEMEGTELERRLAPLLSGEESSVLFETVHRRRDGSCYPVEARLQLFDGAGERLVLAVALDITKRRRAERALAASEARYRALVEQAGDIVVLCGLDGRLRDVNEEACQALGYDREELLSMSVLDIDAERQDQAELDAVWSGLEIGASTLRESTHCRKDGSCFPVEIGVTKIELEDGPAILGVARDISDRRRQEAVIAARMRLGQLAATQSSSDLLRAFLDEAERLTGSQVGFFHYVGADQTTLQLQEWSTNTVSFMCTAEGRGHHYRLDQAGVWADAVRQRRPVVHNDYPSVENRQGLPEGHAPVTRELVVPVTRGEKIVAVLGVGNKEVPYEPADVELVASFADDAWDIVARKRTEEALRASEQQRLTTVMTSLDGFWHVGMDGSFLDVSEAAADMLGYSRREMLGMGIADVEATESAEDVKNHIRHIIAAGRDRFETRHRRKDGSLCDVEISAAYSEVGGGSFLCFARDISERKQREEERHQLESQLRQSQKMEAIGTLAGGIAHDFNNILSAILGYAELALEDAGDNPVLCDEIEEILLAGRRARDLVSQILAFSRQRDHEMKPIRLGPVVKEAVKLLRASIPATVAITSSIRQGTSPVTADVTQIHQLVMNLVTNAYGAIGPEGGQVRVTLDEADLSEAEAAMLVGLEPGPHVVLTVADTGCGMEPYVLEHLFEPYFTTKEPGEGTGMGLAVVHGIVQSHAGAIRVESAPGEGSRFEVYIPARAAAPAGAQKEDREERPSGHERILFVDDEQAIRAITRVGLERFGFSVETVAEPMAALDLFRRDPEAFDVMVTDLSMPGMNGIELARHVRELRADIPILLCSGFTRSAHQSQGELVGITDYVDKPIHLTRLGWAIRRAVDGG